MTTFTPPRPLVEDREKEGLTLGLDTARISISSSDPSAFRWLAECLHPWLSITEAQAGDWHVDISTSAEECADLRRRLPQGAPSRTCFAFDQFVLAMPSWAEDDQIFLADTMRGCFLIIRPGQVRLVGDPRIIRWRMTALWTVLEIAATLLRQSHFDLHAASVEYSGKAILVSGPKGTGKTTLQLHLLRSGLCRWMANDRTLVDSASWLATGMPAAARLRPPTLRQFPELARGMPPVQRVYLYTLDELAAMRSSEDRSAGPQLTCQDPNVSAFSPAQLAHQMGVEPSGGAPLGALVFPRLTAKVDGFRIERLEPNEIRTALRSNFYGRTLGRREATLFETLCDKTTTPSSQDLGALSDSVPGFRLILGPNAYDRPDFAARVLADLIAS